MLPASGGRKGGKGVGTGGLITSHTDAVHCRGDSALAYPEAHADIHARLYPRIRGGVCECVREGVRERACLFRTC